MKDAHNNITSEQGDIRIGNCILGPGYPCFIAAEIGINHNGDMNIARASIEAAAAAGADAVKFQNYVTSDFLEDESLTYSYQSQGKHVTETQWDMFKRCELSEQQLLDLKQHCERIGVEFFSTPTSVSGISLLQNLGVVLIKNGSDFLTHLPLIRCMAESALPTILSVGMAKVAEIDDAVSAYREAGGKHLILLHCTSSYPTPAEEIHLKRIPVLAQAFGCLSGFSDHSEGIAAAVGARVLGACFIEKHFTLDRNLSGPDHRFSSDPRELNELVYSVRKVETAMGSAQLGPTLSEAQGRLGFKLSCVAATDLAPGTKLQVEHLVFRRPGDGIPPKLAPALFGLELKRPVKHGKALKWRDFK